MAGDCSNRGSPKNAIISAMLTRARIALYRSLRRRRFRVEEGLYIVEGRRLVGEALQSGASVLTVIATEKFRTTAAGAALAAAAGDRGIPVEAAAAKDLERIAETKTPQGVVGVLSRKEPDPALLDAPGLFLALDGVADPGNVGTLVRSADAFGARAVLAGPGTADFESGKVLRAAMGSTFHLPLFRTDDLPATLGRFTPVLATTLDGEDLYGLKFQPPSTVLVLGSEAHGVSREIAAAADRRVTIPCPGRAESLNVAMAGAVALAHLSRAGGE
jgi:TrmH family RNA methyltransferase